MDKEQIEKKYLSFDAKTMSRDDIYTMLVEWFDHGLLIIPCLNNTSQNEVEKLSKSRKLSYTPFPKILFVGDSEGNGCFSLFKSLCDSRRILSPLAAKVEKDLRTLYQLHMAAVNGVLKYFKRGNIVLYID